MSDAKHRILFVCIHNSARSQMAEAFLKKYGSEYFEAESAGLEAGKLNLSVVEVMNQVGIDVSNNSTQGVFDLFRKGKLFNAVITVCHEAEQSCPIFPGHVKRIAWSFSDPSAFAGSKEEVLEKTAKVRDAIEQKVLAFISQAKEVMFWV
ncbi:MAG TPA: arsenate reductase ArsC [Puia sp.]|jgi:arsenate reductase|nr:arsenate reductase ArsC [Puia sp.]